MNSAESLIGRVQDLVKDGSFGPSFILEKLNDGLAEVAQMTSPPDLVAVDVELELSAGEKTVLMPADFYGPRIFKLFNRTDNVPCIVVYRFSDFAHIMKRFSSVDIECACLKGKSLLVSGVPTKDTVLEVTYSREPIIFEGENDDGSAITYLPFRLGEQAIVSYAAWKIYSHIEDGIDGRKVNSESFKVDFIEAVAKIIDHFGMESREREPERVVDGMGITSDAESAYDPFSWRL